MEPPEGSPGRGWSLPPRAGVRMTGPCSLSPRHVPPMAFSGFELIFQLSDSVDSSTVGGLWSQNLCARSALPWVQLA